MQPNVLKKKARRINMNDIFKINHVEGNSREIAEALKVKPSYLVQMIHRYNVLPVKIKHHAFGTLYTHPEHAIYIEELKKAYGTQFTNMRRGPKPKPKKRKYKTRAKYSTLRRRDILLARKARAIIREWQEQQYQAKQKLKRQSAETPSTEAHKPLT